MTGPSDNRVSPTLLQRVIANPGPYIRKSLSPSWWTKKVQTRLRKRRNIALEHKLEAIGAGDYTGIQAFRDAHLKAILRYAARHCPYYRDLFRSHGLRPEDPTAFTSLPLLDRRIIRQHYARLISDRLTSIEHYLDKTGGSTGEPLVFPTTVDVGEVATLHHEFLYRQHGYVPGDIVVGLVGSGPSIPPDRVARGVYWAENTSAHPIWGRFLFYSCLATSEALPHMLRQIVELGPAFLRGYPSFVAKLATYIRETGQRFPGTLKGIDLSSETATRDQIDSIRDAFHTTVFLQYGHHELSVYAYTIDDSYEYRCSPLYGITEVLGVDGRHVAIGEMGEVVVTGFFNNVLPFVRYRTGDLAVFGGNEYGVVKLREIVGRSQDYLVAPDGRRIWLTGILTGCSKDQYFFRNVRQFQLVQETIGRVTVRVVKADGFGDADAAGIRYAIKDICGIEAECDLVDFIPLTLGGKVQYVVQKIPG